MAAQRRYWVVSGNVDGKGNNVGEWETEILLEHVAIMGWPPDYQKGSNRMGPQFAGKTAQSMQPGDIVLVARRHQHRPEVVGFGVVTGVYRTERFAWFDQEVYVRDLEPFSPLERMPKHIPISDLLQHTRSLVQLHPDRDHSHARVCRWMVGELGLEGTESSSEGIASEAMKARTVHITETDMPAFTFGYTVETKSQVTLAWKIEAELLSDYRQWLARQDRWLSVVAMGALQCDAWEEERGNLIEAKGTTRREDIRMAVGQLFDYAFQGKERFKQPNMAVLLRRHPCDDRVNWLEPLNVKLIWREGQSFVDNANGQFT